MLSDAGLFREYGPRCSGKSAVVSLNGKGRVTVALVIVEAVKALNAVLVAFRYLTRAGDTGAYNCRLKVGGNGWSIHSLKIALDINWITNPYGPRLVTDYPPAMVRAILAIRTNSGAQVWSWGGSWDGNKDAMHWQIACTRRDLASGINWGTVAGFAPTVTPVERPAVTSPVVTPPPYVGAPPTTPEVPLVKLIRNNITGHPDRGAVWILWTDGTRRGVPTAEHLPEIERLYGPPAQYENARAWDLVLSMYNPK